MEKIPNGPFKATRLWNMVATSFRQIPVGVHWKNMRKYDDCFTSTEAIDWMIKYLQNNPNFGEEKSTRSVAVRMLDRLLQHDAFEPIKAAGGSQPRKFKEDGQLYRFSTCRTGLVDKAILRPLSTLNMNRVDAAPTKCPTPEDVWLDEFRTHLAKLLRLDSPADLDFVNATATPGGAGGIRSHAIDVSAVTCNVVKPHQGNEDNFPQFVLQAISALEHWPAPPASYGIPVSRGFERCLLFVVEGYLRGLSQPLIGSTPNDLLRKVFEVLSPPADRRHSTNLDSSSSVESFMQEIMNAGRRGSYPEVCRGSYPDICLDVCLETCFAGTAPETRLIRKRPRSNSLFPTTDFMVVTNGSSRSTSGSSECIVPKSSSDSGSTGSIPLMLPAVPQTPLPMADSGSGSLEKMNPGYRDDSFGDSDDQFFTPQSRFLPPEIDWRDLHIPAPVYSPDLIRGIQVALLTETPARRAQLHRLLVMFEKIFKNNQLQFSEEFTTQDFVTHCFTPLIFGESDLTSLHLMTLMVLHRSVIFNPVEDLKLKVDLKMKSLGMVSTFCKKITKHEYEDQKHLQGGHMTELLNGIVASSTMNIKEKRKKLKQFQKSYPDIYAARFVNSTSEESIFAACSEKPKPRLTKFKSLRM